MVRPCGRVTALEGGLVGDESSAGREKKGNIGGLIVKTKRRTWLEDGGSCLGEDRE